MGQLNVLKRCIGRTLASRVSVDAGGRILLPKKVRQRLGLAASDELDVEFPVTGLDRAGEDAILLRVVRPEVPLRREGKFWVYRGGDAPAPIEVKNAQRSKTVKVLSRSYANASSGASIKARLRKSGASASALASTFLRLLPRPPRLRPAADPTLPCASRSQ